MSRFLAVRWKLDWEARWAPGGFFSHSPCHNCTSYIDLPSLAIWTFMLSSRRSSIHLSPGSKNGRAADNARQKSGDPDTAGPSLPACRAPWGTKTTSTILVSCTPYVLALDSTSHSYRACSCRQKPLIVPESPTLGGDRHYCVLRQVPTVGSSGPCFPRTNGIILVASLACLLHHWH